MNKLANILTVLCLCISFNLSAQNPAGAKRGDKKPDKTEWLNKMKQLKHEFLTRELNLTPEQQRDFFAAYDAKEEERFNAEREVRRGERNIIKKGDAATDAEIDKAIDAQYDLDSKITAIELKYKEKFQKILTKRQLFKLRNAERDFQKMLVDSHQGNSKGKDKRK